jgi:hypothetical protein
MLGLVTLALVVSPAIAEDQPVLLGQGTALSAGAEIAAASRYVWRGMPVSQGPTLQPSAWLGVENVSLTAWGNIDLDQADGGGFNELDLVLAFSQEWENLSFEPGLVGYILPGVGYTAEVYGDLTWQPGWFGLFSNHAIDFLDARPGWWSESGVLLSMGLPANLGVDASAGISLANRPYNTYYLAVDRTGMQYATAGLGLGWSHASGLYAGLSGRLDWLAPSAVQSALGADPLLASALLAVGWGGTTVWVRGP